MQLLYFWCLVALNNIWLSEWVSDRRRIWFYRQGFSWIHFCLPNIDENIITFPCFCPPPTQFLQVEQSPENFLGKEDSPFSYVVVITPGPALCLYRTLPWIPFRNYIPNSRIFIVLKQYFMWLLPHFIGRSSWTGTMSCPLCISFIWYGSWLIVDAQ